MDDRTKIALCKACTLATVIKDCKSCSFNIGLQENLHEVKMFEAYFNYEFTIELTKNDALSGSHQGACDDDIEALLKVDYIKNQLDKIPSDSIRKELSEYGSWDETELQDEDANKSRILWIACGNIRQEFLI